MGCFEYFLDSLDPLLADSRSNDPYFPKSAYLKFNQRIDQ